jgi:hypothetical protein
MAELCAKDGGVKVYETVALPESMFDRWGDPFPDWRSRPVSERLGEDFIYTIDISYLKQGNPQKGEVRFEKQSEKIRRRADGKLLGEAISYGLSGGDWIQLGHPSSSHCPVIRSDDQGLIKSVFQRKAK